MRHLGAAALAILLPVAALAQEAIDPLRIDPLTGEPRSAFDPVSTEETEAALTACLTREALLAGGAEPAVQACHAETLEACRAVVALYPLAADECLLEQSLAWGSVRNDVGLAVQDILFAREETRAKGEAMVEEDSAWRVQSGDACLISDEAGHTACRLAVEMERATLYLDRLTTLGGSLGEGR